MGAQTVAADTVQAVVGLELADAIASTSRELGSSTDRFMKAFTNLQRAIDERAKELTFATNQSAIQAKRLGRIGIALTVVGLALAAIEAFSAARQMNWL